MAKYGEQRSAPAGQTTRAPSCAANPDAGGQRLAVLVGIGVPALLHEAEAQRRALRRTGPRR